MGPAVGSIRLRLTTQESIRVSLDCRGPSASGGSLDRSGAMSLRRLSRRACTESRGAPLD